MGKRGGGVSPAIANRRRIDGLSGWHREAEAKRVGDFASGVMPAGPTAWDHLLYKLELVSDEAAIEMLRAGVRRKAVATLSEFCRLNYTQRFVPKTVLDFLGLDPGDRSVFYRIVGESSIERAQAARWGTA